VATLSDQDRWPATDVRVSVTAQGPQCREGRYESPFASNKRRAALAPHAASLAGSRVLGCDCTIWCNAQCGRQRDENEGSR
jgi:hypothetical protein